MLGDIKLMTDGVTDFVITGSGRVHGGAAEHEGSGGVWPFEFDEPPAIPENADTPPAGDSTVESADDGEP